ncbi:hypothetical protein Tco_0236737 [Tanacetum coccineum]
MWPLSFLDHRIKRTILIAQIPSQSLQIPRTCIRPRTYLPPVHQSLALHLVARTVIGQPATATRINLVLVSHKGLACRPKTSQHPIWEQLLSDVASTSALRSMTRSSEIGQRRSTTRQQLARPPVQAVVNGVTNGGGTTRSTTAGQLA